MRENLPNATFVGFTGTPVEGDDRSTRGVFGEDVDIYDIKQAIDDNATVPIFYEMQLVKLLPDEAGILEAERLIAEAAEADDAGSKEEPDITVPLEELAGSKERLETLAKQIVIYFEGRSEVIDGKAMIVCMSRDICMDLYDAITSLRPGWHADEDELGTIKVVMDANVGKNDPVKANKHMQPAAERTKKHGRTKARREKLAKQAQGQRRPVEAQ